MHDKQFTKREEMRQNGSYNHRAGTVRTETFGFSRVSFYHIKREYDENGIAGLMPKKRGPKGSRKINNDDVEYAKTLIGSHTKAQIVDMLWNERGVGISKRTLERKLSDKKNE
jgi:transposase